MATRPEQQPPAPPDDLHAVYDDLRRWLDQNTDTGEEFYLDEGPPADLPGLSAASAAPAESRADAKPPLSDAAVPVHPANPASALTSTAKPPVAERAASPAGSGASEAPARDDFEAVCQAFVNETLKQIEREKKIQLPITRTEALLEQASGDQAAALDSLRREVMPCTACALSEGRANLVFGAGSATADVVFIGEAPGRDEDLQGEPFVGRSGQLLTKILAAIDFTRDDVYICNILKCRPPNNRDPQPDEVSVCEPHLKRQLAIIQPRVICCLGRVAAQTLLGTKASLRALRETVHFYEGIPVMATFHPAALLRNPGWKRDTWNDVRKLKALRAALSDRSRP